MGRGRNAFRQLNNNSEEILDVLYILNGHILNRFWYTGSGRTRFVNEISIEHSLRIETTLSPAKLYVP